MVKFDEREKGFEAKFKHDQDKEFILRMRNIIHKEIVVSAHWEDMYQIGDKKNFHKDLLKMSDDEFFNQVANPSKNNLHYGFGFQTLVSCTYWTCSGSNYRNFFRVLHVF